MGTVKGRVKVKVTPKKKPIKPSLGKGTGGIFTQRILADFKRRKGN